MHRNLWNQGAGLECESALVLAPTVPSEALPSPNPSLWACLVLQ